MVFIYFRFQNLIQQPATEIHSRRGVRQWPGRGRNSKDLKVTVKVVSSNVDISRRYIVVKKGITKFLSRK